MQPIEIVLSRLENVRQRQKGQWSARCPAHEDGSPSLSVAETDNGTLLVKCFAGCTFFEIFASLDLDPSDAFPPNLNVGNEPRHTPKLITASQGLEVLAAEANFVAICASNLHKGIVIAESDRDRLNKSAGRIARIMCEAGMKQRKDRGGRTHD